MGQAPVHAKVYELQKLRGNLCGKVFTAREPEGVGSAPAGFAASIPSTTSRSSKGTIPAYL